MAISPAGARGVDVAVVATGDTHKSSVAWAAIIAGALTASAVSLCLVLFGSGVGFASVSPWSYNNPSATTVGVMAAVWLVIVQWASSALGGYLTGRLRNRAEGVTGDELYFRDTAHGFLAWALATIISTGLLASTVSSMVGTGVQAAASVTSGAAQGATQGAVQQAGSGGFDPTGYFTDTLFRSATPAPNASAADARAEAGRILVNGVRAGDVPAADRTYLAQLVAARTGLNQADAERRVGETITAVQNAANQAKEAANTARKTAASLGIVGFLALLIGAFIAAAAAALGGQHRDEL